MLNNKKENRNTKKKKWFNYSVWIREINSFIKVLIISLIIVIPIKYFIIEPYMVLGTSMEPNFHTFDYLFVDKTGFVQTDRGDVVVLIPPKEMEKHSWRNYTVFLDNRVKYIKRVIAMPGESIKIKNNQVYIKKLGENKFHILSETYTTNYRMRDMDLTLKNDEYFVMGDNRAYSKDSRIIGPIKKNEIQGVVILELFRHPAFFPYQQTPKFK